MAVSRRMVYAEAGADLSSGSARLQFERSGVARKVLHNRARRLRVLRFDASADCVSLVAAPWHALLLRVRVQ